MTGVETFRSWAPALIAAADKPDPQLSVYVRQAMAGLAHWDLPIGLKVGDAWIGVLPKKLEGINRWMSDWRLRSSLRAKWGRLLWDVICRGEKVASRAGVIDLGRAPHCQVKMVVQVIRLVPSVREFIRDDDGLDGSPKQLYDAMKDVGLIREDRREWLAMQPVVQDVSPIGVPVTLFILRPVPVDSLFEGAPRVHRPIHSPARVESQPAPRGAEEGRTVPRVRRQPRTRAVDV